MIQGKVQDNLGKLSKRVDEKPEIIVYDADANYLENTFKAMKREDGETILIVDDYKCDTKGTLVDEFVENRQKVKLYQYNKVAILRCR